MSTLLEQASLVLIPSGYKEDVVYSQIPSDGSGDLSFTRASNGTRVNSAGLVEVCPWNLLEQSETFDTASWPKLECSITANSTNSPIGTLTADSLIESNTNSRHMIYRAFTSVVGQSYSLSVYCKQSTRRYANINLKTSSTASPRFSALFDLQTGLNVSTSAVGSPTGTSFDIVSFPNGWYRISISMNATSTSTEYEISTSNSATPSLAEGTPAYLGDGTSGIYIWGAQLNIGSTAKPYFPTTDRLNVPRLTYQNGGGGCPSLLLEKQSTNLALYSEQLDNVLWLKTNASATANNTISPDGTQNAEKLVENTSNGNHNIYQPILIGNVAMTFSVYLKKGERSYCNINMSDLSTGDASVRVNLNNGTLSSTGIAVGSWTNISSSIVSVGNDWYRVSLTATKGAGASSQPVITMLNDSQATPYTGDGTSGIFIWGAQLEASSYPTSLINTTSASATRVADACSKTGISSLIGQTEGTALLDFQFNAQGESIILDIAASGLSPQNRIILYQPNTTIVQFIVLDNSVSQVSIASSAYSVGQRLKVGIAYKANDFALYINGAQIGTDASGSVPSTSRIDIGNRQDSAFPASISVNQFYLSKTRLTNAELASLTTI